MEHIIIASDPLVIVKAISGEIKSPRFIGNIVEVIRLLVKAVKNIKLVYLSRSANMLADMLAQKHILVVLNVI